MRLSDGREPYARSLRPIREAGGHGEIEPTRQTGKRANRPQGSRRFDNPNYYKFDYRSVEMFFFGRSREPDLLKRKFWNSRPSLVIAYDRQRIGKTRLLRETASVCSSVSKATRVFEVLDPERFKLSISALSSSSPILDGKKDPRGPASPSCGTCSKRLSRPRPGDRRIPSCRSEGSGSSIETSSVQGFRSATKLEAFARHRLLPRR